MIPSTPRPPRFAAPVLLFFLLLGSAASAQDPATTRAVRTVVVDEAGWVRVALPPEAIRRLAASGGGLQLFGPEGERVPYRRRVLREEGARVPVEVVAVEGEQDDDGWEVVIDVGAGVGRHDRLYFELDRATAASGVRLEASADRVGWEAIGVGDLFRLGEGSGLAGTAIVYPATDARYLRLHWPAAAGFPRVRSVEVAGVPSRAFEAATSQPDCRNDVAGEAVAVPRTVCVLSVPFPARSVRRLDLAIEASEESGPLGYRLLTAADRSWTTLAEGVWRPPFEAESARALEIDADDLDRPASGLGPGVGGAAASLGTVRLVLYGGAAGDASVTPGLAGFLVQVSGEVLLFRADSPGRYTLVYGAAVPPTPSSGPEPPAGAEPVWVEPGPETVETVASAPGVPLPLAGAPLPEVAFARRFPVVADAVPGGGVARLPLPAMVYATADTDLEDLRLSSDGAQVPYVRWSPLEPELVLSVPGAAPTAGDVAGTSRVVLAEADLQLPLSFLELTAAGLRFERQVRPVIVLPERPGEGRRIEALGPWQAWRCDPRPPLPCRLELPLGETIRGFSGRPADSLLAVEVDDGDDAPLRSVGVELWRRRDVLVFVRPSDDQPLELLAGAPSLEAPSYDLEVFERDLLARPWTAASLITVEAEAAATGARWILLVSLGLAALGLLFLLDRILRDRTSV